MSAVCKFTDLQAVHGPRLFEERPLALIAVSNAVSPSIVNELIMRNDIYARVTATIIAELQKGVRPWIKPWTSSANSITRPLRFNMLPYQGINTLILWSSSIENSFIAPVWMSFKQASVLGAHVRKGQRGTHVVFASTLTPSNANAEQDDTATPRNIPFLKTYTVFNVEQIEDLPSSYYQPAPPPRTHRTRIEHAERFVHATQAIIRHSGTMAAYNSSADEIRLPPFDGFRDADSYYATLIHELLHWTRHPTRLDRSFNQERFGDAGYAMEELVAELGSAFICADLELSPALLRDNASYIDSWLTILNRDKRAIFTAASHAQRAAAYLHSLQSPPCYLTASSA